MSEFVTDIQANTFDQQVLQQEKPVIIDFWAPWCGPCKALAPAFASLAKTYGDKMIFAKCDVDSNAEVAQRYGIKSIPTLMIFQGGKAVNAITGAVSQNALEAAIQKSLSGQTAPIPFIVN